jgi:hypothetical protein
MSKPTDNIPGYTYGSAEVAKARVSVEDLEQLKISVGFTPDDEQHLRRAGEVLAPQVRKIVEHWRANIIASIPNLARHSRSPEGSPIPEYLAKSNLRFEQWILDTCQRPYDQAWIDYQQEIARRHTSVKKNQVDGVTSTPYVPLRDVLAFTAVMNETIRPHLAAAGNSEEEVEKMHRAWCKSIQLQMTLWIGPYSDTRVEPSEW